MQEYIRKNHSKYSLQVHLVFVVKYRKKLLVGILDEDMKQILFDICKHYGWEIQAMETDKDHIHILLSYQPTVPVSKIAKLLKQISTNRIWKSYREMGREFWREKTFWSDGYFGCSTGQLSDATIKRYIDTQG